MSTEAVIRVECPETKITCICNLGVSIKSFWTIPSIFLSLDPYENYMYSSPWKYIEILHLILCLHKSHNTPLLPPKICIGIVLDYSWDMFMSQEKLQTMSMQNVWGVKEVHYGIVQVVNAFVLQHLMFPWKQ